MNNIFDSNCIPFAYGSLNNHSIHDNEYNYDFVDGNCSNTSSDTNNTDYRHPQTSSSSIRTPTATTTNGKNKRIYLSTNTDVRFIYNSYRIVITLDISSSITMCNPLSCRITLEHFFPMLRDFLICLVQPLNFHCFPYAFLPVYYMSVIAVGMLVYLYSSFCFKGKEMKKKIKHRQNSRQFIFQLFFLGHLQLV